MATVPEVRLALILMRTLDDLKNNPEKLRNAVYSMARLKLTDQLKGQNPEEAARVLSALETAIEGVEEFSGDEASFAPLLPPAQSTCAPAVASLTKEDRTVTVETIPEPAQSDHKEVKTFPEEPRSAETEEHHPRRHDQPQKAARDTEEREVNDDVNEKSETITVSPTAEDWETVDYEIDDSEAKTRARAIDDPFFSEDNVYAAHSSDYGDRGLPLVVIEPQPLPPLRFSHRSSYAYPPAPPLDFRPRWTVTLLAGLVVVLVGLCSFFFGRQLLLSHSPQVAQSSPQLPPTPAATTANPATTVQPPQPEENPNHIPLPAVYGIFALSDNKLVSLTPLVGRVPDARVAISGAIVKPSATTLADGKLQFVVYRRDVTVASADHFDIRVIAKIMQSVTFGTGKAALSEEENTWAIRSIAFPFSVAPILGKPDMLLLRPQKEDLVLPAGRYGLVLNAQAYDFSVAGEITDPDQCLQRFEAANGSFYSPCPPPQQPKKTDDPVGKDAAKN